MKLGEQPTVNITLDLDIGPRLQLGRPAQTTEQRLPARVRPFKIHPAGESDQGDNN